ncbi:mucoidy inhibitor A [Crepidotus variabilis]|uniref:Mucoidy inhibitor A n=1 Tax=Crepidotus variabilis TaxID=179855 RepID=A0A9P6E5P8_9AGAR|nr:mucoidy inhibitor A [Crepidotus variabilis]
MAGTTSASPSTTNVVHVNSQKESEITNVNLYSGLAEITRVFKISVAQGMNELILTNLPDVLKYDSLRVSGKGPGTIHNVKISVASVSDGHQSARLSTLVDQKEDVEHAIERSKRCITGLEHYLKTIDARNVDATKLSEFVDGYDSATGKYDARLKSLQKELPKLDEEIDAERSALARQAHFECRLRKIVSVGFVADESGDIEIQTIYFVSNADWKAAYDIRVSTQPTDDMIHFCYKASIQQNTGEPWTNVPLILQTTKPSLSFRIPTLDPWSVSIYVPPPQRTAEETLESDDDMGFGLFDDGPVSTTAVTSISQKSDLNTSYRIPGMCNIATHTQDWQTITVQELEFPKKLLWLSVPKKDPKVHLTVDVTNKSDYTLVGGNANVFVDGSFLSSIYLAQVNPQDTFNCPLGVDQALRVTYSPLAVKKYESGFYTKTSNHLFTQRIAIASTKTTTVDDLTILDHVPFSENKSVTVSLKSPALRLPEPEDPDADSGRSNDVSATVKVENGVVASWHDVNKSGDPQALGKDGMMKWVCSLAPSQKLNLLLQWEVSAPVHATVTGLPAA